MGTKLKGRRLGEKSRKNFALRASLETAALASVSLVFDGVWKRWMDAQAMVGISKYCGTEKHSQALELNPLYC